MKKMNKPQVYGWIAVGLSTLITSFWAFWGIIENFHEGWYHKNLLSNLGLMLFQYLSPMLIFMGVALVSIFWPRIGGGLHGVIALLAAWFFDVFDNTVIVLILLPLIGFGSLYWFGRPKPRKLAVYLVVGLPILTLILSGMEPVWRVSQRVFDGNLDARRVQGNGVDLIWAPDGPGWPQEGMAWEEAGQVCQYLSQDGLTLSTKPQKIWRLPTVEEAVGSMTRGGENSGGVWEPESAQAAYDTTPDKESPLWNGYSQVIYWWTATEVDETHAYMIVYDGRVWSRAKEFGPGYLGYRCVKQP